MSTIADSPRWFQQESAEAREAAIEADFNNKIASSEAFQTASPEQQANYKLAHRMVIEEAEIASPYNPENIKAARDQRLANMAGWGANSIEKGVESHKDAAVRSGLIDDTFYKDGKLDPNAPKQIATYLRKQNNRPLTDATKRLGDVINRWDKTTENSGFIGDVGATLELVFKDLPMNAAGIAELAAESASSITASMMGGWAGAKAGGGLGAALTAVTGGAAAPLAPFITAGGAMTGMAAAGAADAGTYKFIELFRNELEARGIPFTETNVRFFVDNNPKIVKEIQGKARKYGTVMGAVDTALGAVGAKLGTLGKRAAKINASKVIKSKTDELIEAANELGVDPKKFIQKEQTKLENALLSTRSFKRKLGDHAMAYTGEVASEPASEAASTAAIGEEVKAKDLIYETLGGIGAGPYGTAVNVGLLGSEAGGNAVARNTKDFVTKMVASTPESRAANKEQKAATKVAKKQSQSPAQPKFKEKAESIDPNDRETIDNLADPNKGNDPILAVAALSKSDEPDAQTRAKEISDSYKESAAATYERIQELREKAENNELSQEEIQEAENLGKTFERQLEVVRSLDKLNEIQTNRSIANSKTNEVTEVDPDTATAEELVQHITDSFGSHEVTVDQLNKAAEKEDATPEIKELAQASTAAAVAKENLQNAPQPETNKNDPPKSLEDVNNDIYTKGAKGFKGILAYKHAIGYFMKNKNTQRAVDELNSLRRFRDSHKDKAVKAREVFDALGSKEGLTPEQQALSDDLKSNRRLTVSEKSGRLVSTIELESAALDAEVAAAESILRANKVSIDGSSATQTQQATEAKPEPKQQEETKTEDKPAKKKKKLTKKQVIQAAFDDGVEHAGKTNNQKELKKRREAIRAKHGNAAANAFTGGVRQEQKKAAKAHAESFVKKHGNDRKAIEAEYLKIKKLRGKEVAAAFDKAAKKALNKPKNKKQKIQEELQDVAGLAKMLGIENEAVAENAGSIEDIHSALKSISAMLDSDGDIDKKQIQAALKWLHTADVELTQDRKERATYKTYDQVTGEKFSPEKIEKNRLKYEKRSKGNPERYLLLQLHEELMELLSEHLDANDPAQQMIELSKRVAKVERFGADTVIKDINSPYNGKTNLEAALALAAELKQQPVIDKLSKKYKKTDSKPTKEESAAQESKDSTEKTTEATEETKEETLPTRF